MSKVTRIAYSQNLNQSKCDRLEDIARRLGRLRAEVWRRFGSVLARADKLNRSVGCGHRCQPSVIQSRCTVQTIVRAVVAQVDRGRCPELVKETVSPLTHRGEKGLPGFVKASEDLL